MSLLINWLKSFIWSSDDPLPKENQIALIKNSLNETNEKIQKIDEGLKKINEQNQQTAEKNKATFKGLQKINQQLLLLTDSTDFDKFCDFLIKDYKDVGYEALWHIISGLFPTPYSATSLREYFAIGFEEYYIRDNSTLRTECPILYSKISELEFLEDK